MTQIKLLFVIVILFMQTSFRHSNLLIPVTTSQEERALYQLIMDYRASKKLPIIPWSHSMTIVAKAHSKDLNEQHPDKKNCNGHSWSKKGKWKSCCYTPDHKNASCMWDKPRELTNYKDDGFEIVCSITDSENKNDAMKADLAMDTWKKSKHHNDMIINKDIWKKVTWNAIGISIEKDYAVVWFGKTVDAENENK